MRLPVNSSGGRLAGHQSRASSGRTRWAATVASAAFAAVSTSLVTEQATNAVTSRNATRRGPLARPRLWTRKTGAPSDDGLLLAQRDLVGDEAEVRVGLVVVDARGDEVDVVGVDE